MKIDKTDMVKIAGIAGTLLSLGATLLTTFAKEEQLNQKVEQKVEEILKQKLEEMK